MHGFGFGETLYASAKARRRREPPGVQFRIAAGKPAEVAFGRRRLVGERRKREDLRPGRSPAMQKVRIDERERRVASERDPLSGQPNRGRRARQRSAVQFGGQLEETTAIDMRLD